jgi:hypothetical protein
MESVEAIECKGGLGPIESRRKPTGTQQLSVIVDDAVCSAIAEVD